MTALEQAKKMHGSSEGAEKLARWRSFAERYPDWEQCTGDETKCGCTFHRARRQRLHDYANIWSGWRAHVAADLQWMRRQTPRAIAAGIGDEWLELIRETEAMG